MILQNNIELLRYNNKVIFANKNNGMWIRVSEEVATIILDLLEEEIDLKDETIEFEDEDDRTYFYDVVDSLLKCYIVVNDEKELVNEIPKKVLIELTNRCNLKCSHCCVSANNESLDIDSETMKQVLLKCINWNADFIGLSGGEPLLRKDFHEILSFLRKNYSGKIGLCTNATLLNEENVKFIIKNVDQIDISIDGVDEETCSIYRGKGVFTKVINAIKLLHDNNFTDIYLSMVFSDKNEHLEKEFLELNGKLNTNPICRILCKIGRANENFEELSDVKKGECYVPISFIEDDSEDLSVSTCGAGKTSILIRHDGTIYPCASFLGEKFIMGNILNVEDIDSVVNNNMNLTVKKALVDNSVLNIEKCKDCSVKLFCWSCPGEVSGYTSEEIIDQYCEIVKPILINRVWGE